MPGSRIRLLAIDTTEEACSAALAIGDELVEHFDVVPRRHSELVLPMMDRLLSEAGLRVSDLDALAFARGPGSFTGVRIAASVVQGAALGADLPVVAVSSLQALAQGVRREHGCRAVYSALDARMHEVYWGAYRSDDATGLMQPVADERVCAPSAVSAIAGDAWCGAGSGWQTYAEVLDGRLGALKECYPAAAIHARDVAAIAVVACASGAAVPAEQALPVYLRNQVAWTRPG